MKTREQIEQIALERYPTKYGGYDSELINSSERKAFIEGYTLCQEEDKWISVEDGLPELYSDVLCAVNDEYPNGDFSILPMIYSKELNQFLLITLNGLVDCTSDIIYWQPLPTKPFV